MNYYDDGGGGYYSYDYDDYDHDEPVIFIEQDFSEHSVTDALVDAGLLEDATIRYSGSMEGLVFTLGNDNEIYSREEIRFTERMEQVIVYEDFAKKLSRGTMACRVIAAKVNDSGTDAVKGCIAFEKITDKALDGFNIFFFVTDDSIFFGARLFEQSGTSDCLLSRPIQTEAQYEQMVDELLYVYDSDYFMDFYIDLTCWITSDIGSSLQDYDALVRRRRGIQISYLDAMDHLQKYTGIDFSLERRRYQQTFEKSPEMTFSDLLEDVEESLSFIKSNRINTYEMLFEADEMLREASAAEAENERLLQDHTDVGQNENSILDEEAKAMLNDPEEMIKLLKKRRGI